ncbi:MAG: molybdopterin dinucleotide binding domain-containing protein, partial [Planctomycetota bacterium]
ETFSAIARAMGLPSVTYDATPESLCEELLEASRQRIGDANLERLRAGEPVAITPAPLTGKRWDTPSGLIELRSPAAALEGLPELPSYVPDDACGGRGAFWLTPAPSKFGLNSTFSHSARHMARAGRPRVFVHPDDAARVGVEDGKLARLSNEYGAVTLDVECSTTMSPGVLRVDGVPRSCDVPEGVGINALVAPDLSDLGRGNVLYSTRVDLEPARA